MLTFLAALPVIGTIVTGLTSAFFNAKVSMYVARTGAIRDVAVAAVSAQAAVETKYWWAAAVVVGFQSVALAYFAKCVIWDTMFGWGVTDPLNGHVGWAFVTVVGGTFVTSLTSMFTKA